MKVVENMKLTAVRNIALKFRRTGSKESVS